jgi:hypothetical protein
MSFIAMDPPRHTRIRALISRGFAPGRVAELEPNIRRLTRAWLDPLLERRSFDLIAEFAAGIPVAVISELVGVPPADRNRVHQLSQRIMFRDERTSGISAAIRQALDELSEYYAALAAARRHQPTNDLISMLVKAEIDGDKLTHDEVVAVLLLMSVAGNETTPRLVGSAWHAAWQHPSQCATAFAHPAQWVEETLRYDGPSQLTARHITTAIEMYGAVVPAGSRMLLLGAAANRDPRVFPDPERFDVTRDTSPTLAFGIGPHFCLGAALARLEARVMLEELAASVRTDFDIDLAAARRARNPNVRGFSSLPTMITPR